MVFGGNDQAKQITGLVIDQVVEWFSATSLRGNSCGFCFESQRTEIFSMKHLRQLLELSHTIQFKHKR